MRKRLKNQNGNTILEFAVVVTFLVPLLAGAFTTGMTLAKGIQVAGVCRDAGILMIRAVVNPYSGLDLSQTQNQKIIVRASAGLGMALDASQTPDTSGKSAVILSKVLLVGDSECATGISPAPAGAPPWNAGNCPNYGSYVFAYRVVVGNQTRWASVMGTPPSSIVGTGGVISAHDIASNTADRASHLGTGGIITLAAGSFALISEMYADVSALNLFSTPPILYARNVT